MIPSGREAPPPDYDPLFDYRPDTSDSEDSRDRESDAGSPIAELHSAAAPFPTHHEVDGSTAQLHSARVPFPTHSVGGSTSEVHSAELYAANAPFPTVTAVAHACYEEWECIVPSTAKTLLVTKLREVRTKSTAGIVMTETRRHDEDAPVTLSGQPSDLHNALELIRELGVAITVVSGPTAGDQCAPDGVGGAGGAVTTAGVSEDYGEESFVVSSLAVSKDRVRELEGEFEVAIKHVPVPGGDEVTVTMWGVSHKRVQAKAALRSEQGGADVDPLFRGGAGGMYDVANVTCTDVSEVELATVRGMNVEVLTDVASSDRSGVKLTLCGSVTSVTEALLVLSARLTKPVPPFRGAVIVPAFLYRPLVGKYHLLSEPDGVDGREYEFPKLKAIEGITGARIAAPKGATDQVVRVAITGTSVAQVRSAEKLLYNELQDILGIPHLRSIVAMRAVPDMTPPRPPNASVFVDYSNLAVECQAHDGKSKHFRPTDKYGYKDPAVALRIPALCEWIDAGRRCERRVVVGAMSDTVSAEWMAAGYHVTAMESDKAGHADEVLHAKISDVVMNVFPGVLVLASGDGNINGNKDNTSFGRCVGAAIRAGWKVEVVCWSRSLGRLYHALQALVPSRFTVKYLDDEHEKLCFRLDGQAS